MNLLPIFFTFLTIVLGFSYASKDWSSDMQPGRWNKNALEKIQKMLKRRLNHNVAKNVILFLGDGDYTLYLLKDGDC